MRVKHTVQVQISQDTEQRRKLYSDDVASVAQTDTTGYARQANSTLYVEPAAIENLSFGDVAQVRGVYLEANKEARVRLNGASDPLQLRIAAGATVAKLLLECEITQITIENPSEDALAGVYVVWGDPVAI